MAILHRCLVMCLVQAWDFIVDGGRCNQRQNLLKLKLKISLCPTEQQKPKQNKKNYGHYFIKKSHIFRFWFNLHVQHVNHLFILTLNLHLVHFFKCTDLFSQCFVTHFCFLVQKEGSIIQSISLGSTLCSSWVQLCNLKKKIILKVVRKQISSFKIEYMKCKIKLESK